MTQHSPAVFPERFHKHILNAPVRIRGKTAGQAREESENQAETACNPQCPKHCLDDLLVVILLLYDFVQSEEAQQRNRHLQHGQGHRNRPELVVHRRIFEPELCEPHKMAAPGEQNGECRGYQYPYFVPAPEKEESEHKQENAYCTQVHRPGSERLRSPVHRQSLHGLLHILLSCLTQKLFRGSVLQARITGRCLSVERRYEQVGHFIYAVGPGCGIFQIQSVAGLSLRLLSHKFRPAPHGIG